MGILSDLNTAAKSGDTTAIDQIIGRYSDQQESAVAEMQRWNAEYESAMQQKLAKLAAMAASLRK